MSRAGIVSRGLRFSTGRGAPVIVPADGTGGTSGVSYLAKALELKFFPELWQVRTSM